MPFDGNGNFELLYDFEVDRDAGFPSNRILAEKMMDMFQDVAAGLEGAATESAERLSGTSTTSTAIGTGSKVFTTQADKAFTVGRWLLIASDADEANYMHGRVTAYSGTSLTVEVTNVGGSGTLADWTITISGTRGATGSTGATGAQGAMAAVPYNYSTTTTDSDPGSGNLRFNHATPASATEAYIDNENRSAADVSAWLDTLDDNGNSSLRGTLYIYVPATPGVNFRIYSVTGSVVDGTGYRKLTIAHVAGGGSFTNGAEIDLLFVPRGATGAAGAGTGDVVGPASAADGEDVQFDGASGKLIKSAAAAAYRVGGTDVAIADGGTGASTAAAAFAALKQAASDSATGVIEHATTGEIRAATTGNLSVIASELETASAVVALTETSGAVAVDWDTFINGAVTVDQATVISNPTNGQPGTWRTIMVQGNDATDRTITFGNQFLGDVPTITDCDSTRWYQLMIYCHTTTHFVVSSKKANGT